MDDATSCCHGVNRGRCGKFFDTFNKALQDYTGDAEYIWDPFLIMMDEKGANFEAIKYVFGHNFHVEKTVTCQFHFMNCAEKYPDGKKLSSDGVMSCVMPIRGRSTGNMLI